MYNVYRNEQEKKTTDIHEKPDIHLHENQELNDAAIDLRGINIENSKAIALNIPSSKNTFSFNTPHYF